MSWPFAGYSTRNDLYRNPFFAMTYYKRIGYLILISTVAKLLISGLVELGNDEVYYYTYALRPDWSYFDHPPFVGWLIRLSTLNLHWVNTWTMRLGPIACCAISTFFIFDTGKAIGNEKTGWYAALIYQCAVYTGIIAGLFILPDSPQMPFWTGALCIMARLLTLKNSDRTKNWLLLGLLIGLATLSKVHGLYLWAGFGLFILFKRRAWLLRWQLYAAFTVTLVCLIPIVYWNIQNHFITYTYHSARVTHTTVQWDSLLREVVGEMIYQNPIVFVLLVIGLVFLIRRKSSFESNDTRVWLLCMSLPMILLFWGVALFNPTLPHWSGPAYIPLFFGAAFWLSSRSKKIIPSVMGWAGGLIVFFLAGAILLCRLAPFNLGSQEQKNYGEYCPTLDLSGWNDFGKRFAQLVHDDLVSGKMKPNAPLLVSKWFPGGHLQFYVAPKACMRILGVGELEDLHEFAWLNRERAPLRVGDDAYYVVPSNVPADPAVLYGKYFSTIDAPVVIDQVRGGKVVRYFWVYRLRGCRVMVE